MPSLFKCLCVLHLGVVLLAWQISSKDRAVPPQQTKVPATCADYKFWYEQDRERLYDRQHRPEYRLRDLRVTTYPDGRTLDAGELMDLLQGHRKELGIDTIGLVQGAGISQLSLQELMYPQYFEAYTLSQQDWAELQRRAKWNLEHDRYAHPDVIAHWKTIAAGHPPFGLKVRDN